MNMRIVNQINKNLNNPIGRFSSSSNKKQRQNNNNSIDLAMLMPVSYLLPATHGDGIYIYALIVFLVEAQNEFVQFYRGLVSATRASISKASGSSSSTSLVSSATNNTANNNAAAITGRVDLDELSEASCICVEPRRDLLLNTVYVCSNYSLECASELSFEYDYAKIQRIVEARFVARKPIIETSVRNFEFYYNLFGFKVII